MGMKIQRLMIPMGDMMQQQEPPTRPHVDAQLMELHARVESMCADHDLKPGDIVVEKEGLGMFQDHCRQNMPMMIVRRLDMSRDYDRQLAMRQAFEDKLDVLDCVVAWVDDDGSRLLFQCHCMGMLRKFTT